MNVKVDRKTAEEHILEYDSEKRTVKKVKRTALLGVKKGAVAAKRAASKIASAPAKIFDGAVYGACYGLSYGTVFSSLMVSKMLSDNSIVLKAFHDGAVVARKDFKTHQEHQLAAEKTVVAES
jgi:hypothetical protein